MGFIIIPKKRCRSHSPPIAQTMDETPVRPARACGSVESVIDAIKQGAYTYSTKPIKMPDLELHVVGSS